ncbi:MAG: cytochrome c family protein, partial [Rhizobiales bacterium]|nr:cytochrome c family protein [Hyphomicrobiales bacterium]
MSHNHAAAAKPQAVAQGTGPSTTPPAARVPAAAALNEEAAAGRQVYRKCQACHSTDAGKNGLGPTLAGVMGEKAGHVSNYSYSPAMKNSGLTWDAATLDRYLADPQKTVPGNKMPFPGLKNETERRTVIAYLATMSGAAAAASSASPAAATSPTVAQQAPAQPPAPAAPAQSAAPQAPGYGAPSAFGANPSL